MGFALSERQDTEPHSHSVAATTILCEQDRSSSRSCMVASLTHLILQPLNKKILM
jgi:hypothetical protein